MVFLIIVLIIIALLGIWYIHHLNSTETEREIISNFITKYESSAEDAIRQYYSLINGDCFFSDGAKNRFINKYRILVSDYKGLKQPKNVKQENPLRIFEEFLNLYDSIGDAQVSINVAYFNKRINDLPNDYNNIHNHNHFVGYHEVEDFKTKWEKLLNQFASLSHTDNYKSIKNYSVLKEISLLYKSAKDGLQTQRLEDNKKYRENELKVHKAFFDSIFSYPLDQQQRQAVITMEDNTLVVSSAGSGKTSTIVAKVRYLVTQKNVNPNEILVLTYTRKAAEELRERMGIEGISASTFHRHAMDTIGLLKKSRPDIVDSSVMLNIFDDLINNDKQFLSATNKYVTEFSNLAKDDFQYVTSEERCKDMQKYGLQSPYKDGSGERKIMKSKQEVQISVILTHLGVDFRYEEPYIIDTSTANHRKYKPDFVIHYYVNETGENGQPIREEKILYYEHFGIDAQGQVPVWFGDGRDGGLQKAQQDYTAGINWKRQIHSQYGTALMVTTSADFQRFPDMEAYIEQLLHQYGVPTRHISEQEKKDLLLEANGRIVDSLFSLVQGFIALMKANKKTINDIISAIHTSTYADRNRYVLDNIVRPVYDRYQRKLLESKQYDFTDILIKASELCEKGNPYNYRYILVDEFQDISMDKYLYLKSLRKQNPFTSLFCVGDDWQSIYRFSGSDMTLFYDFAQNFGYTEECKIETTHRFGQPLLNASSLFVLTNPQQKKKNVSTTAKTNTNIKFIPYYNNSEKFEVESIVKDIPYNESIYILGRYSFNINSICVQNKINNNSVVINGREIPFFTIHSAKGLEADHVIILDCNNGTYGFPSLIADDPILELVLSGADSYDNAEERRVFYVGITRAKKCTYCLFNKETPSPFLSEFGVYSKYQNTTEAICPRCHQGYVRVLKRATTNNGDKYVTVNCTNTTCDYFETLFGDSSIKYQPRNILKNLDLNLFNKHLGTTDYHIDYNNRILYLINHNDKSFCPLIIAPNIVVNELLFEDIKRNPVEYEVAVVCYNNSTVCALKKHGLDLYLSDEDIIKAMNNAKIFTITKGLCQHHPSI